MTFDFVHQLSPPDLIALKTLVDSRVHHLTQSGTCFAVQYADQMKCDKCGFVWDTNDPDGPPCTWSDEKK